MAKVTVNIDGTPEEVVAAIQTLAGLRQPSPQVQVHEEAWTEEEIKKFWGLLSSDAKKVFEVIAKKPDGFPRNDVLEQLGMKGNELAGTMSSQGHTLRHFPGKSRPVVLDDETWEYTMKAELSDFIGKLSK